MDKAEEAQKVRFGGKAVWKCIRDMQYGRRGLVPSRLSTVNDEEGNPCVTPEAQQERWRGHFSKVLNVQSQFSDEELDKVRQRPVRHDLAEQPTMDELTAAIGKLKNGKAGGASGVLPEMVKAGCSEVEFLDMMLDLVQTSWREKRVPKDWSDAVLVPIPKKGDMRKCDNWRGIALLDVVGKVIARIIQERLQKLAQEELPESQCGFRRGRGCSDMVFTVRQLVEKSWEHRSKTFLVFIDLKKAYDSVPRAALWRALGKLGVPDNLVELIRSFHCDMQAQIRLNDTMLDPIDIRNGLCQGCCMAPVLFNLYSCVVIERWTERVKSFEGVGVYLRCKLDQKLFRRYTRNHEERRLTDCQFADDAAFLATTKVGAERATEEYMMVAKEFGLTLSIPKTKLMPVGRLVTPEDMTPLSVGGEEIEPVSEFPYLGSVITSCGRMELDINRRIAQASKAFGTLRKPVFMDKDLNVITKRKVYQACVLSVLLYGSECWTPLKKQLKKLDSFHNRCVRTILGISNKQQWEQRITSSEIRGRWGDPESAANKVKRRRLEWLGHVARMPDHRIPKACLFGWLPQPRPRGGPRLRWRDLIRRDLKEIKVSEEKWYEVATNSRSRWRATYTEGLKESQTISDSHNEERPQNQFVCEECNRRFRQEGDRKRHKCLSERQKPVSEQRGAVHVQCPTCTRWFRSRGGLAVHRCRSDQDNEN